MKEFDYSLTKKNCGKVVRIAIYALNNAGVSVKSTNITIAVPDGE